MSSVTPYFLKDLIAGAKKFVKCSEVSVCFAPHYEDLTVQDILDFAICKPGVEEYFPDKRDIPKLPRQWVINVAYTIIGPEFQEWVDSQVSARNKRKETE